MELSGRGRDLGRMQGLRFWLGHGLGSPHVPVAVPCPPLSPLRELTPAPFYILEVYRLWYISPKSLVFCFGFFS